MSYRSKLTDDRIAELRDWHERAYQELRTARERTLSYLGLELVVPPGVFPPTPTSDLLGRAVIDECTAADRVLDMGTGSGVNAILAARAGADVLGVDVNPASVAAAERNAARNGVTARFAVSDVFEGRDVSDGTFDLMVIDPPFRWFAPRDLAERAITDEGYAATARFFDGVPERLRPGGRVLMFFGTSGDQEHILGLAEGAGLRAEVVATRRLTRRGTTVDYSTFRLTRPAP
ncbi:methyltransferase [Pseudonocardia acaciae]|uniref:methyltransferase n=1 Tax=Pseudonocardia acaciae TaxID=551276 RepID=UPI00048E7806|nr:methyltransferase [Pseudonocardia acaciae]